MVFDMKFQVKKCLGVVGVFVGIFCFACNKNDITPEVSPTKDSIDVILPDRPVYNTNRLFIKHGLQLGCWVGSEDLSVERKDVAYYVVRPEDWGLAGFTGPTFFTAPAPFNSDFMLNKFPESQWSMAKAPYGLHLKQGPTDYEMRNGFLNADQKVALDRLTTICIGDEENYSYNIVKWTKDWFGVIRKHCPDVLLHNNQWGYGGQWTEDQLRFYIQTAQPDFLTFDAYYFLPIGEKISYYRGAKAMADDLMMYRALAMEGIDGTGDDPLAFGQYTQGYKQDGTYEISESELRLYYSMTWAFGGKWLNWFRWLQGNDSNGETVPTGYAMLLENGMPGSPTKYMSWVAKCNSESKAIGEHLVRLQTDRVYFIKGDQDLTNGKPERVESWNDNNGQMFTSIKKVCISDKYKGRSGDLYIGTFNIIPASKNGDPAFFESDDASYFMIVNAFTTNEDERSDVLSQKIEFSIDKSKLSGKSLYLVSKEDGLEREITGEMRGGSRYYSLDIIGGGFDLICIR